MKIALNDNDLEKVCGGSVDVDPANKTVSFSTLEEVYKLKTSAFPGEEVDTAETYVRILRKQQPYSNMPMEEFEKVVKKKLQLNGWI